MLDYQLNYQRKLYSTVGVMLHCLFALPSMSLATVGSSLGKGRGTSIFNWYNVQALTNEMHALQLDQLSEQILFLFDCVWCTLQLKDTNVHVRFEL